MPRWRAAHAGRRLLCGLALAALALPIGGGAGCTLLLDTSANPQKCSNDGDCARFPNAACDNAHKVCVPKLPYANDAGMMETGAGGTGGAPVCGLAFDNATRLDAVGPDGGLRPLPDPDGGTP